MATNYTYLPSPVGDLLLAGIDGALQLVGFPTGGKARRAEDAWQRRDDAFPQVRKQLTEYFAGERREFDLDLQPNGTPFQLAVLDELRRIPYGATRSYADIAEALGKPTATRAVGAANGRNPLPIVIPCHRVVGKNGDLTGFGGGLPTKRFLLDLEQRTNGGAA